MVKIIKDLLCEKKDGKPSLKRIAGFTMLVNGIIGKNLLAIYAMAHEVKHYSDIDNTFDSFIFAGVALLFGSIIDKFTKK